MGNGTINNDPKVNAPSVAAPETPAVPFGASEITEGVKSFTFGAFEIFKKALAPLKALMGTSVLESLDEQGFLKNETKEDKDQVQVAKDKIKSKLEAFERDKQIAHFIQSKATVQADTLDFLQHATDFPLLPLAEQITFLQGEPLNFGKDANSAPTLKWSKGQRLFHATVGEARKEEQKDHCESAAELFEAAAKLDPKNLDVHMAAARNFKQAAEQQGDAKEKERLYARSLEHLQAVASQDPRDTSSLKMASEICLALKKPEAVQKIKGEIFDRELKDLDAEITEFNAYAQSKPRKALNCIKRIEKIEARIQKLGIQDPQRELTYLTKLHQFYSKAIAFEKAQRVVEGAEFRINTVAFNETMAFTGVEARLSALRETVLKKSIPASGAKANVENLSSAAMLIQIDKELGNYADVSKDLDAFSKLLADCPPETLGSKARMDAYGEILKGWVEVRDRVKGKIVYSVDAQHPAIPFKLEELNGKMKVVGESLVQASASFETAGAKESVSSLIRAVVEEDNHELLDFLSSEGLQKFAELKHQAQENYEKAGKISDPEKKRVALVTAFGQFAALKDKEMTNKLAGEIEAGLQGPAVGDTLRLQVYSAMSLSLRGSGLEQESKIKEKGSQLAQTLVEGHLLAYTSEGMKERVGGLLVAAAFYQSIGDPSSENKILKQLEIQKHLIGSFLREGDPIHKVPPPTDASQRVELAGLAAQIEAMTLLPNLEAASKGGPDDPPPPELPLKKVLVFAKIWREEIEKAKDLPMETRLQQLAKLSTTLAGYKPLTKGRDPVISGADLYRETSAVRKILDPMMDELFAQGPEASEGQKKMAGLVATDVKERIYSAFVDGDTKWLSGLSLAQLREVGEFSQMGHALLMVAKESKGPEVTKKYLQAAQVFAKAGLKDRVAEALAPVVEAAKSSPDSAQGGALLLTAAQLYQSAGMTGKADEVFDGIIALDKPGAPSQVHDLAVLAKASQFLNHGKIEKAKDLLLDLPANPVAQLLLKSIEAGEKQLRTSKILTVVRIVMEGYIQGFRAKGKKDEAAKMSSQMEAGLKEVQRLVVSGECATLDAAYAKVQRDPRFAVFYSAETVFQEKSPVMSPERILHALSDPALGDEAISKQAAAYVHAFTSEYSAEAEMLCRTLFDDPYVGEEMRAYATDAGGFKGAAIANSLITAVTTLTPVGIYASSLNPNSKQFYEGMESAGIMVASFGVARFAAVGGEALFLATDTAVALGKASPTALRLAGFGVKTGTEAAAFTLSNMFFQSAKTGTWNNWTAENFGKEFGSMLVTFVLLHGVGAAVQKFGQAAEKSSWLGVGAEEGAQLKASGQMALKPGARVAFGVGAWGARVSAFAGSEYVNEGLGLKPGEDVPFLVRFLGSAITDAQMIVAGKLVDAVSGGKIGKMELSSQVKYNVHELLPELKKMGFEIDPKEILAKGFSDQPGSPAEAVLRMLVMKKMKGESVDSIFEDSGKGLKDIVQKNLKLDPKSPEGQAMMANLLGYALSASSKGEPMSGEELARTVTELQDMSKNLLKMVGMSGGPDAAKLQQAFLQVALTQGKSPKDIDAFFKEAATLTKDLPGLVDAMLGEKSSATPLGKKLIGDLLVVAFARFSLGESGKGADAIDAALEGLNKYQKPANVLEGLKKLCSKENAGQLGKALGVSVEVLLGKDAAKTLFGKEVMAQLFLAEFGSTANLSELPLAISSLNGKMLKYEGLGKSGKDVMESLETTVDAIAGKNFSKTPEGRELMAKLLLIELSSHEDAGDIPMSLKSLSYQAVGSAPEIAQLAGLGKIKSPMGRFTLFLWAKSQGLSPKKLGVLAEGVKSGKIEISVKGDAVRIEKLTQIEDKDILEITEGPEKKDAKVSESSVSDPDKTDPTGIPIFGWEGAAAAAKTSKKVGPKVEKSTAEAAPGFSKMVEGQKKKAEKLADAIIEENDHVLDDAAKSEMKEFLRDRIAKIAENSPKSIEAETNDILDKFEDQFFNLDFHQHKKYQRKLKLLVEQTVRLSENILAGEVKAKPSSASESAKITPSGFLDTILPSSRWVAPKEMEASKRVNLLRDWAEAHSESLAEVQKQLDAGTHMFFLTFDGKIRYAEVAAVKIEISNALHLAKVLGMDVQNKSFREALVTCVLSSPVSMKDAAQIYQTLDLAFKESKGKAGLEERQQALLKVLRGQITSENVESFVVDIKAGNFKAFEENLVEANLEPLSGENTVFDESALDKTPASIAPPSVDQVMGKTGPKGGLLPPSTADAEAIGGDFKLQAPKTPTGFAQLEPMMEVINQFMDASGLGIMLGKAKGANKINTTPEAWMKLLGGLATRIKGDAADPVRNKIAEILREDTAMVFKDPSSKSSKKALERLVLALDYLKREAAKNGKVLTQDFEIGDKLLQDLEQSLVAQKNLEGFLDAFGDPSPEGASNDAPVFSPTEEVATVPPSKKVKDKTGVEKSEAKPEALPLAATAEAPPQVDAAEPSGILGALGGMFNGMFGGDKIGSFGSLAVVSVFGHEIFGNEGMLGLGLLSLTGMVGMSFWTKFLGSKEPIDLVSNAKSWSPSQGLDRIVLDSEHQPGHLTIQKNKEGAWWIHNGDNQSGVRPAEPPVIFRNGEEVEVPKNGWMPLQAGDVVIAGKMSFIWTPPLDLASLPPAASGNLPRGETRLLTPHADGHDFVIGRLPGSDLVFDDAVISGTHAIIRRDGKEWLLFDGPVGSEKRSKNGISVNGVKITDKSMPIKAGDVIEIDGAKFVFHEPKPLAASAKEPSPYIGIKAIIPLTTSPETERFFVGSDESCMIGKVSVGDKELWRIFNEDPQGRPMSLFRKGVEHPLAAEDFMDLEAGDILSIGDSRFEWTPPVKSEAKPEAKLEPGPKKSPVVEGTAKVEIQEGSPDILAGDVDLAKIPLNLIPANDKMGSIAAVATQGGKEGPNEDVVLTVTGPKGEQYILAIDGMGGEGNGNWAALFIAKALKAELGRGGDIKQAMEFANFVVGRFNAEFGKAYSKNFFKIGDAEARKIAEAAALPIVEQIISDPDHAPDGPISKGSGAVLVCAKIVPPDKAGDPHTLEFYWAGDAKAMLLDRDSIGKLVWVYRTVEENYPAYPGAMVPGKDYEPGGLRKTLAGIMHPLANKVLNAISGKNEVKIKTTAEGEVKNPKDPSGSSLANGLEKGMQIKSGQFLLIASDGFWENFGYTQVILELIQNCQTAEEANKVLTEETHFRMEVLQKADQGELPLVNGKYEFSKPGGIFYGKVVEKIRYNTQTGAKEIYKDVEIVSAEKLYIDGEGNVYEHPGDEHPVDHYKLDNYSLVVYQHNPLSAAAEMPVDALPMAAKSSDKAGVGSKVASPGKPKLGMGDTKRFSFPLNGSDFGMGPLEPGTSSILLLTSSGESSLPSMVSATVEGASLNLFRVRKNDAGSFAMALTSEAIAKGAAVDGSPVKLNNIFPLTAGIHTIQIGSYSFQVLLT